MNITNIKLFPSNKHLLLTREGLDNIKSNLDRLREERFLLCDHLLKMDKKERLEYILNNDIIKTLEMNEKDITKITELLQYADVVPVEINPTDVKLGSTVDLQFGNQTLKYTLVNTIEADPSTNKISEKSPLGKALLGKKKYDIVRYITPKGTAIMYKLLAIA